MQFSKTMSLSELLQYARSPSYLNGELQALEAIGLGAAAKSIFCHEVMSLIERTLSDQYESLSPDDVEQLNSFRGHVEQSLRCYQTEASIAAKSVQFSSVWHRSDIRHSSDSLPTTISPPESPQQPSGKFTQYGTVLLDASGPSHGIYAWRR